MLSYLGSLQFVLKAKRSCVRNQVFLTLMVTVFFMLSLCDYPPCRGGKTGNGKTGLKMPMKVQED